MRCALRHRQNGQAIGLAAVAMIAVVGAVAFVIDLGFFIEGRRELQLSADQAALAGVVFLPGCWVSSNAGPNTDGSTCAEFNALEAATHYLGLNGPIARQLCGHPTSSSDFQLSMRTDNTSAPSTPGSDVIPGVYTPDPAAPDSYYYSLTVTIRCSPGFSFGKIIMGAATEPISASATAIVGAIGSASCAAPLDVVAFPPPPSPPASYPPPYGTTDNNYGYLPGLDNGVPINLYSSVQSYIGPSGSPPYGTCVGCGNFLEVCLDPSNCGGSDVQAWFAGTKCISLDTSVGQNLTGKPGFAVGDVASGLGARGYDISGSGQDATCRQTLIDVVDTSTWKVKNNASPCLIQVAIIHYDDAFNSTGRSTFKVDGFATIFLQSFVGSGSGGSKYFTGVYVQSTAPGKILTYRNNATYTTRLIR